MSEMEFDSRLPHLEQGGWQPGMHWVPTVEQQAELEIRAEAEAITDRAYEIGQLLGGDWEVPLTFDSDHIPPQDPEEREKAVIDNIVPAKRERDYANRPFDVILKDTLRWIDQFGSDSPDRWTVSNMLEHEATALLRRKVEYADEPTFDTEIVHVSVQWAAITHVMHHYYHMWADGFSYEESLQLVMDAGVPDDELRTLLDIPMNEEAEKILRKDKCEVAYANQAVIEKHLLEWAKTNGVDISSVHTVAYQKFQLGI